MKMWCDFDPILGDASEYEKSSGGTGDAVLSGYGIYSYMMDGVLIVKF